MARKRKSRVAKRKDARPQGTKRQRAPWLILPLGAAWIALAGIACLYAMSGLHLEENLYRAERNYKSLFQHYCQRALSGVPTNRILF